MTRRNSYPLTTAIILSPVHVDTFLPGLQVLNYVSSFDTTGGIHEARRNALQLVTTPYCFFLDSDDELTNNVHDILETCYEANVPICYTDELIREAGRSQYIHRTLPYDQEKHIRNPRMLHHLVVMNTEAARAAEQVIPHGELWVEMLLYFQMAKRGAKYINEVGYIWNRGNGMNRAKGILAAQVRAAAWCARNKD